MEELLKLKTNLEKLIEANYEDYILDDFISDSKTLCDLNECIEDEISYWEWENN